MGQSAIGQFQPRPGQLHEPAGERASGGNGYLLAKDRPERDLCSVNGSRDPESRRPSPVHLQDRVSTQAARHGVWIGIEVEQSPAPLHGGTEVSQVG